LTDLAKLVRLDDSQYKYWLRVHAKITSEYQA